MKMRHFGKFTILWEYFRGNRYSGKIPMDMDYGTMPRSGGSRVKID
jgi:hypothetical protein